MENLNFVKKVQKYYQLTSNGYLLTTNMIKLIDNWYATNKNEDFWNSHDLTAIPQENLKNIYLLKNAECISSTTSNLSKAYNSYTKLIENVEELKITLPIFSENHLRQIVQLIQEKIKEQPDVTITYFIPDDKKQGGKYKTVTNSVKKIDTYKNEIILIDGTTIAIDEIIDINSEIYQLMMYN